MRFVAIAVALGAVVSLQTGTPSEQSRSLTFADVLARVREQAPQIVIARLALEETRGRLVGASRRIEDNPELDVAVGNRTGSGARSSEFELGFAQMLAPGSRRSARLAGANAAVAQSAAEVEEVTRVALHAAASAYYRAVHAKERLQMLAASQDLAARVHTVAESRFKAGDIAILDVNLARASLARVRAEREAAVATETLALGELNQWLRVEGDVAVEGELLTTADRELAALLRSASQRPELTVLEAGVREAEADVRLGQTFTKPDYGFGVRYEREEGDQIVLGGLTLTLPLFSKGQELRATGTARAARLRAELEAAGARVRLEVRSAFGAYERRSAAVRVLGTEALPGLDENETLSLRSFEVGQLGLPELLLIRREILETRFQYLDSLLEAALARVTLDATAAVLR